MIDYPTQPNPTTFTLPSFFFFHNSPLTMVKDSHSPFTLAKHNHVLVKLSVSIFLMGLAFRLLYSHSFGFLPIVDPPHQPTHHTLQPLSSAPPPIQDVAQVRDQNGHKEKCDIFTGDWIPNPSGPIYNNESCLAIQDFQNCMRNGRPDSGYLYWRWNPRDCELPRFDAQRFLELMRSKWWAFVGDSISRNHVQSLLCILSTVEEPTEFYHDEQYKSKKWLFPSYNFTLSVVWSPFLVKSAVFENDDGISTAETQLYLDEIDQKWASEYHYFDYMVIAGGKWFLKTAIYYENNTIIGCHYCNGEKNLTELGAHYAYRKALQLIFNFSISSNHKATVLYRTATPDHFEDGEWSSGGTCKRTVPFKEGEIEFNGLDSMLRDIELEEFEKAADVGSRVGVTMKLLDTSSMSLLRPDGHPGPYRHLHPFAKDKNATVQNDCLHWCLPGPIDSWNDLVMEMVVNL